MKIVIPMFALLALPLTAQAQVAERMNSISKECLNQTTSLDSDSYADRISKILDLKKEAIQQYFKSNTDLGDKADSRSAMEAYRACSQAEVDFWTLE